MWEASAVQLLTRDANIDIHLMICSCQNYVCLPVRLIARRQVYFDYQGLDKHEAKSVRLF
jgi:hypothetical protein